MDHSSRTAHLNFCRYADTSPPPEQFDVRAILRGGIPVSEVEDEYIQETLQMPLT
jgi:type I restriction enzyme M protein